MAIHMDCFGLTDVGRVRESNQDQFLIGNLRKSLEVFQTSLSVDDHSRMFGGSQGKLLIVADGMGGHASGERASTLAVDTLSEYCLNSLPWLFRLEQDSEEEFVAELRAAMEKCDDCVKAESEVIPDHRGMGTTLTIAYVIWPRVYVIHAGDSRCYLVRHGKLFQVTRDHTMGQELLDEGILSEEEIRGASSVLWNCVGGVDNVRPHAHRAQLEIGDALLLCSDGLTKHLTDQQIEESLASSKTAEIACRNLVDAANRAGGSDNITVVLARFEDVNQQEEFASTEANRSEESSSEAELVAAKPSLPNATETTCNGVSKTHALAAAARPVKIFNWKVRSPLALLGLRCSE